MLKNPSKGIIIKHVAMICNSFQVVSLYNEIPVSHKGRINCLVSGKGKGMWNGGGN